MKDAMMPGHKMFFLLPITVLISGTGCSRTDNEPGPGGVTVSEAKALDDAAEMLESRDAPAQADPAKTDDETAN